ncbi:hypothetical protein P245_22990 [Comamonas thiooxydans]|uniref:Uncharacterized protein n=1 Tax=Comamonas thiooxydans TaxID=363952 RepID=A0A0E3BEW7_9BURK|nr:hypothetical protein P245_22990 [Comamonas thiooxydans]
MIFTSDAVVQILQHVVKNMLFTMSINIFVTNHALHDEDRAQLIFKILAGIDELTKNAIKNALPFPLFTAFKKKVCCLSYPFCWR